jgi:hypothetical protein
MDKKSFIGMFLFVIAFVVIILISGNKYQRPTVSVPNYTPEEKMFLNNQCEDLKCIASKFVNCTLAEYARSGVRVAIYGFGENTCHVRTSDYDCYFYKSDLTIPLLNQLLGNNEGLGNVITQYCK